jgi:hypothetical protein
MEIPPPQYPSFPVVPLIPKQALSVILTMVVRSGVVLPSLVLGNYARILK